MSESLTVCIIGGNGFVGKALQRELAASDALFSIKELRIFDQKDPHGEFTESLPRDFRSLIHYYKGDICDSKAIADTVRSCDLVFHVAAIVDWGTVSDSEVLAVNYEATKDILRISREAGVRALVFTSSLDAIISGKPIKNADESFPYPPKHPNSYCQSKALAEQCVIQADSEEMHTAVIRPGGIFGEYDPYHLEALASLSRQNSYFRIGNGSAKTMNVYVGNIAHGLLLAGRELIQGNSNVRGKIYFIGDTGGEGFFPFLERVLVAAECKLPREGKHLPAVPLFAIGAFLEFIAFLMRPFFSFRPKLSRFAVRYITTEFTFNWERARKDLGYSPKYTLEEAVTRSAAYIKKKFVDNNEPQGEPDVA